MKIEIENKKEEDEKARKINKSEKDRRASSWKKKNHMKVGIQMKFDLIKSVEIIS